MVFIKGALVASLAIINAVSAAYTNDTIPLPYKGPVSSNNASIMRVQIIDTLTNSQVSHNLANWFAISVEVAMEPGSSSLNITFPPDFNTFPQSPIDLMDGCTVVGSVSYDDSNVFTVSFSNNIKRRIASFNVLSKLNLTDINEFDRPRVIDYTFGISETVKFLSSIHYEADTMDQPTSFAGFDADGRTWFAVDVPSSVYPGELTLKATSEGNNTSYDKNSTEVVVVAEVDAFKQPLKTIPLKSFDDFSDSSSVKLHIDNKISGAAFIRIKYYVDHANTNCIQNTAVLSYTSRDDSERMLSNTLVDMICLQSASNVQLPIKEGTMAISPVCRPFLNGALFSEQQASQNSTTTMLSSSSAIALSTMVSKNLTSNVERYYMSSQYDLSNSTSFDQHATVTPSTLLANRTTGSTHFVAPVTSLASNLSAATTIVAGMTTNSAVYPLSVNTTNTKQVTTKAMTFTVFTFVEGGKTVEYTSWFPISTSLPSSMTTNSTFTQVTNELPTLVASNGTAQPHATSAFSNSTAYKMPVNATNAMQNVSKTAAPLSYTVLTFVQGGKTVEYTSWFPIQTLTPVNTSRDTTFTSTVSGTIPLVISNKTVLAHITAAPFINSTTYQLRVNASKTTTEMTHTVFTSIKDGKILESTSWMPIPTLAHSNSSIHWNSTANREDNGAYTGTLMPFSNSTRFVTLTSSSIKTVTCQTCIEGTTSQSVPVPNIIEAPQDPIVGASSTFIGTVPASQPLTTPDTIVSSSSSDTIGLVYSSSTSVAYSSVDQYTTNTSKYIGGVNTNQATFSWLVAAFLTVFL